MYPCIHSKVIMRYMLAVPNYKNVIQVTCRYMCSAYYLTTCICMDHRVETGVLQFISSSISTKYISKQTQISRKSGEIRRAGEFRIHVCYFSPDSTITRSHYVLLQIPSSREISCYFNGCYQRTTSFITIYLIWYNAILICSHYGMARCKTSTILS